MRTSTAAIPPPSSSTGPAGSAGRRPATARPAVRWLRGGDEGRRVAALAEAFARLYLEVECGRRSAAQARPLLDHRLALQLEGRWVRPGTPGRLIGLSGGRTAEGVYDAVAVVRRGERVGALALRLERRRGRWLVTCACRPEDGPLPRLPYRLPEEDLDVFDLLGLDAGAASAPSAAA